MTIFLSYAREDITAATELYRALRSAGLNVWFDKESLQPGANWKYAISTAIRTSRYFLALLSSNSAAKRGFVQAEVRQALAILDEFPETDSYVIPVRLDACTPSHPRLNDLQWVDLFPGQQDGIDKLLRFFGAEPGTRSSLPNVSTNAEAEGPVPIARQEKVIHPPILCRAQQREVQGPLIIPRQPTVHFDGLYQSEQVGKGRDKSWSYIRFFPNGLVITVSSTGEPRHLKQWFDKNYPRTKYASSGRFTVEGRHIKFISTSSSGTVDYEGEIIASSLILRSHSHINGNRAVREYKFVSFN